MTPNTGNGFAGYTIGWWMPRGSSLTRRAMLMAIPSATFAQTERSQYLANEFTELANAFISDWNILLASKVRGRWDVKLAAEVEHDFRKLTEHPGWITTEKLRK